MEGQIWRLYDAIDGVSVLCESQEECEHLITKWATDRRKEFVDDVEDFYPFYKYIDFDESDSITPMGYECKLTALIRFDVQPWGAYAHDRVLAHYFYYHDRDEEAERERIEKERKLKKELNALYGKQLFSQEYADTDSVSVKKPYTPPTLTAIVRGEVCKFIAETASPTDWTPKQDGLYNDLQSNKEKVKELIEELGILLDCLPGSDKALKVMEDCKQTTLFNLKPSSFKYVICKALDLIAPF